MKVTRGFRGIVAVGLLLAIVSTATAKYSGGTGEPNDPYQVATAADLIALGETPEDCDKHFILTADIDLDPNLPGRKVFDRAVIAPARHVPGRYGPGDRPPVEGSPFAGVFDGKGHTVSHLVVSGGEYVGLFGRLESGAEVSNLGIVDVNVTGSSSVIGGLVGQMRKGSRVSRCYSTGAVIGGGSVGGLVGVNGSVDGEWDAAGTITDCHSISDTRGGWGVGGLVGSNGGSVTHCHSAGAVSGSTGIGGLVGSSNGGSVTRCYSIGAVSGTSSVGGLVGSGGGPVLHSVWDIGTSGQSGSAGGVGLTTAEMMDPYMLGLNGFANDPNWLLDAGRDYPRLGWETTVGQIIPEAKIDWLAGHGTAEDPYRIDTAQQLILLGSASILWDRHYLLGVDIDLDPRLPEGRIFRQAVIPAFTGVFDGNGRTISHLVINGNSYLGLFGQLASRAEVKDLAVVDINITGSGNCVGGLVGRNSGGTVTHCYSTGAVRGGENVGGLVGSGGVLTRCHSTVAVTGMHYVGGLVGDNFGVLTQCYSTGAVHGSGEYVGGLVGWNADRCSVSLSYSTGAVSGDSSVGGLVGHNSGTVTDCYSTGAVSGDSSVGGLVGYNRGNVTCCYSTGTVTGKYYVGGLLGDGSAVACFWDIQTSGQAKSWRGTGKTTAEMQRAATFLDAGWDFVGETANGTEDIWWIDEGKDYPRLWWEAQN